MRPGALMIGAVVSVILLGGGRRNLHDGNDSGEQHYRKSINVVQQVQRLSSDWSIEISRVKADPLADFDFPGSVHPPHGAVEDGSVRNRPPHPDLPDRLANSINAYVSAVDAKEERVERFKTGYAVVRNSNRYLPLAAANVVRLAEETDNQELARNISRAYSAAGSVYSAPTDSERTRLTARSRNSAKRAWVIRPLSRTLS